MPYIGVATHPTEVAMPTTRYTITAANKDGTLHFVEHSSRENADSNFAFLQTRGCFQAMLMTAVLGDGTKEMAKYWEAYRMQRRLVSLSGDPQKNLAVRRPSRMQ